ncbi:transposase [Salinispora pacifica]|uniref:transposase n=1 Tax=Salinispora pacifica TaxID=351187 RepID=UPI00138DEA41|nr:transposase [Salinispora pacifica]
MIDEIVGWRAGLDDLLARIAHRLGRAEPRRQELGWLLGMLSPLASKNGWTLVEAAVDTTPDRRQRLLNRSAWDSDAVRDGLFAYVGEHLGHDDGVLIVDETGFHNEEGDQVGRGCSASNRARPAGRRTASSGCSWPMPARPGER